MKVIHHHPTPDSSVKRIEVLKKMHRTCIALLRQVHHMDAQKAAI